jgi:hypothetical protein
MTRYRERLEAGEFAASESGEATAGAAASPDLDAMTKAELLAYAQQLGVTPANNAMSKDELRAAIDEAEG